MARFIEALDDVLHDVYWGTRQREVGWTMGNVGRSSSERTTRPRVADPASPDLNQSLRTDFAVMPADRVLRAGDRVVVTGATGFVGSAVARALQARGADLVAMVEPGADVRNLRDLDVHRASVDIRDAEGVRVAVKGARFVFHLAAVYRFWARDRQVFREVNVGGTINVLDAVRAEGIERLVYTSTVGVLGLHGTDGSVASGDCGSGRMGR